MIKAMQNRGDNFNVNKTKIIAVTIEINKGFV